MNFSHDGRYFGFDGAALALDPPIPAKAAPRSRREVIELERGGGHLPPSIRATALVFQDPRSRALEQRLRRFAASEASVLIVGQTGTGKELVARHVHACSPRAKGPFIAINCAALPEALADAELFGHEKGAFTGAVEARAGYFEAAQGGTLLLDEIGDLSLSMQVKLLRVLQERAVVRLGARSPRKLDVRIVAATNVDLERAVAAGRFRQDLFFRLNVARLEVLPLASRPGDIDPLVEHFLGLYAQRGGRAVPKLALDARSRLHRYSWPGNIRELENTIHHALLLTQGETIEADDLNLAGVSFGDARESSGDRLAAALERLLDEVVEVDQVEEAAEGIFERVNHTLVTLAMQRTRGNQVQAAKLLGISRNTLRTQLTRFGYLPARGER